jgi:ABC-type Fe3+-hydroxamate transport system substrate-binding protein
MKKYASFILAALLLLSLCACGGASPAETLPPEPVIVPDTPAETIAAPAEITVTDMIGRSVSIVPGSYKRVVCIGAGALRMYSCIGDVSLLAGVGKRWDCCVSRPVSEVPANKTIPATENHSSLRWNPAACFGPWGALRGFSGDAGETPATPAEAQRQRVRFEEEEQQSE